MMIRDIFKKLQGVWSFSRNLIRNDVLQPLGTVKGTVKLSSFIENNNDLYYLEEGELIMSNGEKFNIRKEYIYSYHEKEDQIEKYFAQDGKKEGIFYKLNFKDHTQTASKSQSICATGEHLCSKDNYQANYEFLEDKFKLTYKVNGPNKDYTYETVYEKTTSPSLVP